ncbi:fibronectin type III domain-containing protein 1-like [Ostrea edulis]|uniref:fibronectin type III domain-containing protein 1-like n=1 Tax=Ostrea edulis TaxID=37623 RepID=UPI0024AF3197|nr:fibronectin type III domain-containing protein 1-like [Ostrea edulis]
MFLLDFLTECMTATPPCWYAYNVTLDDSFNGRSGGTTLVRRTALTSAPYLAVVLCSSTRYKLFLAANLTTTFLNIGDGNGSGEDHCELVGGSESTAVTAGDYVNSPAVSVYYRSSAGEEFSFGNIGYAETEYYFNSYLECGVSIPGTDAVV